MSFSTFDIEPEKKKKLNFFKIGKILCFKYFFDDKEILKNSIDYDEMMQRGYELKRLSHNCF